ncbi:MAG: type II toxin-antitoxin system RelE/ParE family toxin [Paludibacteraceae bacterium]|nr:type II toxin-antitoxin system RelE/ParE family toxin [Paludibacteraceae bacterium]
MALIGWSHTAKKQLVDIYTYYSTTANENIANSFWSIIEEGTANLCNFPSLGKVDLKFSTDSIEYRFIIIAFGKQTFKMYYIIQGDMCIIQALRNCSQDDKTFVFI